MSYKRGRRQKDELLSHSVASEKEDYKVGKVFAYRLVESLSQDIVYLGEFYAGFEDEVKRYAEIAPFRSWRVDKSRILGVLDVIQRVIAMTDFEALREKKADESKAQG